MKTLNREWSKYKYYPHLNASEDLLKGGWILHFMANGGDEYNDYLRCQNVDCRFARTEGLCQQRYKSLPAYLPKYSNWYNLPFPLVQVDVMIEYGGQMEYDDLPDGIRQACNMAEKHLLVDNIFEKFVYDKTRRFKNEWEIFTNFEKDKLVMQFKDGKRADEENLRQYSPQAEFDPYYKPKQ